MEAGALDGDEDDGSDEFGEEVYLDGGVDIGFNFDNDVFGDDFDEFDHDNEDEDELGDDGDEDGDGELYLL
jgi:hypothetical protein